MRSEQLAFIFGFLLLSGADCHSADKQKDVPGIIDAALGRMNEIALMEPDTLYTVSVAGAKETGPKEFFIGLRTGEEVLASRVSSGCSDYAAAFYKLMKDAGLKPVFIIGTTMSFGSLLDNFSDHTGVAVRNGNGWILADPTQGIVVSKDWDHKAEVYEDEYYIGYKGPLEDYNYKGPIGCKEHNRLTIQVMPPRLLNEKIPYLDVYADDTMKNPEGKENVQVRLFRETLENFYKSHKLSPSLKVKLKMTRDPEKYNSSARCYVKECVMSLGAEITGQLNALAWAVEDLATIGGFRRNKAGFARFDYTVDASMKNPDVTYVNPYLEGFLKDAGDLNDALGLTGEKTVKVTVVNAGDNAGSDLHPDPARGWLLSVGTRSAMSLSLQKYLQDAYAAAKR
ncbi:MAG: transglutaminase domain-containing protein [Elusimicrobia bacterium]|nr:transglutaminase domain-containing protein [Elusimicrobiota bacterium]